MTVDSPQPTVQRLLDASQSASYEDRSVTTAVGASTVHHPGEAKLRILQTAARLFYDDGIQGVGIDRLIAEARVTKATFYKHYRSKDNVILEYVRLRHASVVEDVERLIAAAPDARSAIRAWIRAVVDTTNADRFRGCAFMNAAAEYHDPRHPVRTLVSAHRDWYTDRLAALLQDAGHPLAGDGADELMLARDGAMAGSYAGDPIAATTAFSRVAERVLAA